jgi:hypothetical protein
MTARVLERHVREPSEGGSLTVAGRLEQPTRRFTFCIAGTQKSATSTLSWLLGRHPHIQRAPRKEMHYFDREAKDWARGDFSDYAVRPRGRRPKIVGDATPSYLWWPRALDRIHAYDPGMKLIAIFRDPIERLFSQWVMGLSRWPNQAPDWPGFLTGFAPDGLEDRIPDGVSTHTYRMHSGLVRGYYGAQLERGFAMFGAEQFHVLEFRAFLRDYTTALDGVTDFLEIPRFETYPPLTNKMPGRPTVVGTAPTGEDIEYLVGRYREDFEKFKALSGLDVSEWPLQQLVDGTLDPEELAGKYAAKVVAPEPATNQAAGRRGS